MRREEREGGKEGWRLTEGRERERGGKGDSGSERKRGEDVGRGGKA